MKLVLIGYMGSGKSVVANQLAQKLQYDSIDLDAYIETQENCSISTLFSKKGEIYFRRKENEYLHTLIENENNFVLATGGGTPCYYNSMETLNAKDKVVTIYLKTDINTLTSRLFHERAKRPLISHLETKELLTDFIRKHLFERAYYYNQATLVIDTTNKNVQEVVKAIVSHLF
ncbi:MAG: shikimate kinase [Flavobacteriales bacterium]|jgi:shikimate kinase|nr:shikimate kinase [Flavobacteriales bacterium]